MYDDDKTARLRETFDAAMASIVEMTAPILDDEAGSQEQEEAREMIEQDALSVLVREGWKTPGGEADVEEFEVLISTGGPAVRIYGTLGAYGTIETAELQVQDWFTPWTAFPTTPEQDEAILTYASQFYFGEA